VYDIRRDVSPVLRKERLLLGAARPVLVSEARFNDSIQERLGDVRALREKGQVTQGKFRSVRRKFRSSRRKLRSTGRKFGPLGAIEPP
jgi:hypothetical protein